MATLIPFDPMLIPNKQSNTLHSHGDAEVKVPADHFFDGDVSKADKFKWNGRS